MTVAAVLEQENDSSVPSEKRLVGLRPTVRSTTPSFSSSKASQAMTLCESAFSRSRDAAQTPFREESLWSDNAEPFLARHALAHFVKWR